VLGAQQVIFLCIGAASGLMVYAFRDLIISIYNVQPATQELARQFITVLSITIVGTSYQVACLTGIVRGGGHTKFVFYNDLIFMWGLVLPSSFLAAFVFELAPVWIFICLKADQILKCFVAVVKVNSGNWMKKI
jgi:Na+-driven multidrug efflux pump